MNLLQAKTKTRKLIEQYSVNGVVIADTNKNLKDYMYKMPDYFDMAQKEIATIKPIRKTHKVSQNLPANKLGNPFEIVAHSDTDLTYSANSAYAYSFAVNDVITATMSGSVICLYINEIRAAVFEDAVHASAIKHGLNATSGNDGLWNDFSIKVKT